ncbi:hypothetical protein D556_3075 [Bordetella holmesii 41130]|nr:hypothetical protein D558_3078 [Bordetella holmesii 44057]EWM40496.1 hypothetical protein D555_3135 [Bordetella holmesii 35009]EWM43609.1 hypothetical protein D556_3075 [Bordetella holmesii 41130]
MSKHPLRRLPSPCAPAGHSDLRHGGWAHPGTGQAHSSIQAWARGK